LQGRLPAHLAFQRRGLLAGQQAAVHDQGNAGLAGQLLQAAGQRLAGLVQLQVGGVRAGEGGGQRGRQQGVARCHRYAPFRVGGT